MAPRPQRLSPPIVQAAQFPTLTELGQQPAAAPSVVPAQVGATFRAYTTALGQALPHEINRARFAMSRFGQAVR